VEDVESATKDDGPWENVEVRKTRVEVFRSMAVADKIDGRDDFLFGACLVRVLETRQREWHQQNCARISDGPPLPLIFQLREFSCRRVDGEFARPHEWRIVSGKVATSQQMLCRWSSRKRWQT